MLRLVHTSIALNAASLLCVWGSPLPIPDDLAPPYGPAWGPFPQNNVPYVPITYPKYGEIWVGATHHNVTWDTKGVPKDVNYTNTAIFLMQKRQAITDEPLATNFSLLEGRVNVQMPKDVNGDGLQVVLYVMHGARDDRGSYSPDFTMINIE